jgi:hypothetical protein
LVISIEKLTDKIRTSFIVFKFQGVKSATWGTATTLICTYSFKENRINQLIIWIWENREQWKGAIPWVRGSKRVKKGEICLYISYLMIEKKILKMGQKLTSIYDLREKRTVTEGCKTKRSTQRWKLSFSTYIYID